MASHQHYRLVMSRIGKKRQQLIQSYILLRQISSSDKLPNAVVAVSSKGKINVPAQIKCMCRYMKVYEYKCVSSIKFL